MRDSKAFSLIELLIIMSIVAILVAIGSARWFGPDEIESKLFVDDTLSVIRYAQQVSVATGCDTQVTLTSSTVDLKQRASCKSGTFTTDIVDPKTNTSGISRTAPDGVTITTTQSIFYFNALGQSMIASGVSDVTITISSSTISVEGETGFVREG